MVSVSWFIDRPALTAFLLLGATLDVGSANAQHECVPPLQYVHDGDCTEADKAAAQNRNCTSRFDGTNKWCCCEPRTGPDEEPPPAEICVPPMTKVHDGSCTQTDVNAAVDGNCTDRLENGDPVCCCEVDKDAGGGCNCTIASGGSPTAIAFSGAFALGLAGALYRRRARRRTAARSSSS